LNNTSYSSTSGFFKVFHQPDLSPLNFKSGP